MDNFFPSTWSWLKFLCPGEGTPWKIGYKYVLPSMTPFSGPPGSLQDPHFRAACFSSQDPTFAPKSRISRNFKLQSLKIGKGFCSKESNWVKIQFTRLHFAQKFQKLYFCGVPNSAMVNSLASLGRTPFQSWVPHAGSLLIRCLNFVWKGANEAF